MADLPKDNEPATENLDDPVVVSDSGIPTPRIGWALIRDGIVEKVARTYNRLCHPFQDVPDDAYVAQHDGSRMYVPMDGVAVIPATIGLAEPGMLVDAKGNFTPAEGRAGHLHPSEPAYLGGPSVAVGDTMRATRDDDEVLKASQERTEAHAEREAEFSERMSSDEAHSPLEHAAIEGEQDKHAAESEPKPE